ncbi:MAG: YfhO family protein [Acidobacteriota bacterium]
MLRSSPSRTAVYLILLAAAPFVFFAPATRGKLLLGDGDTLVHTLPFWTYAAEQWKNFAAPFWAPHIFAGYPIFAEPQASVFHPLKLLFFFLSPLAAINLTVLIYYSLAGIFTYLLAREERLTAEAALLAGIIFSFSGYLIGHQAMTSLHMTAASFPLIFYALRRMARTLSYPSILFGAGAVLFVILGGHAQLIFYALFYGLFYAAWLFFLVIPAYQKKAFFKAVLGMYVLGVLLSAFQLLPTYQLTTHSTRDEMTWETFVSQSRPPHYLISSLVSTRITSLALGGDSESMVDVGLPALLLAGLGIWLGGRNALFWTSLLALSSLLFLGAYTPIYQVMYWVPGYNLFRIPPRNGVAIVLALSMLAAIGLSALQHRTRSSLRRRNIALVAIAAIYFLSIHLMDQRISNQIWQIDSGPVLEWSEEIIRQHLLPLMPQMLLMVGGTLAIAFLLLKFGGGWLPAALMIALAFTHFWTYRSWIFAAPAEDLEEVLQASISLPSDSSRHRIAYASSQNWIAFLREHPQDWRLRYRQTGGPNLNMLSGPLSISGYAPLILRDYSRLAGEMSTSGVIENPDFFSSKALQLLSVKYVLAPRGDLGFSREAFSTLDCVEESPEMVLYRNPSSPELFWGVRQVRDSTTAEFWRALQDSDTDFLQAALLTDRAEGAENLLGRKLAIPAAIDFEHTGPNSLRINVRTQDQAFVASSLLFYPGWSAWLNGEPISLHRVNGLFMGFPVPSGSHQVTLRFSPLSFWTGLILALASLPIFGLVVRRDSLRLKSTRLYLEKKD